MITSNKMAHAEMMDDYERSDMSLAMCIVCVIILQEINPVCIR